MPWYGPQRPSVQIGALKGWLNRTAPDVKVDAFHYHLAILTAMRYPLVKTISEGTWGSFLAEGLSACLLFPGHKDRILRHLQKRVEENGGSADVEKDLLSPFERFIAEQALSVDWSSYDCVGLSAAMLQTFSSVLMAKIVKERAPSVLTALGGPEATGPMGLSLLKVFPEIDCTVHGEGEKPLAAIVEALRNGDNLGLIPGVVTRSAPPGREPVRAQVDDLDLLPCPDYDAYFEVLSSLPWGDEVRRDLEIPVEGARGCWWANRGRSGNTSCAFCNLNHQWEGYREKTADRFADEMGSLSDRYSSRRFLFLENITRRRAADSVALFRTIRQRLFRPPQIAMEARADTPPHVWRLLREAGVVSCQTGIESLSTRVLKRIGKGTTAIRNVETMKALEQWDIIHPANLLHGLPDMTVEEVEENVEMIPFVKAYYPLRPCRFSLRYGSPYWEKLSRQGEHQSSKGQANDPEWRAILPEEVEKGLFLSSRAFFEETPDLARAVHRLEEACDEWLRHYTDAKRRGVKYLLSWVMDGTHPGGLIIRDFREERFRIHRLAGPEAAVYAFFDTRRRVKDCAATLPHIPGHMVEEYLRKFVGERLLLREGPYALSLAISLSRS